MIDPEEVKHKIEAGEITHTDIYALIEENKKLIEEIEQLRSQLAKEEFNRRFGM